MASGSYELLRLVALLSSTLAFHQGTLQIEEDGKVVELHVVALAEKDVGLFTTSGASLTLQWGGEIRGFLAAKETDAMPSDNYYNFTLFNKEFSYDVDLSAVGCSCNAALFFTSMPGRNPDGTVAKGRFNPYYCDANQMGGVFCWEHDVQESNKYNMATTMHNCNAAPGQYTTSCDRVGCQSNSFKTDPKGFCPHASCKIDSRRPYRVNQRYQANDAGTKLISITNHMTQGNSSFDWGACIDEAYLAESTVAFKSNMAMVFQVWGDSDVTMNWLDSQTGCSGACVQFETVATFSNIALRSLGTKSSTAADQYKVIYS